MLKYVIIIVIIALFVRTPARAGQSRTRHAKILDILSRMLIGKRRR